MFITYDFHNSTYTNYKAANDTKVLWVKFKKKKNNINVFYFDTVSSIKFIYVQNIYD